MFYRVIRVRDQLIPVYSITTQSPHQSMAPTSPQLPTQPYNAVPLGIKVPEGLFINQSFLVTH